MGAFDPEIDTVLDLSGADVASAEEEHEDPPVPRSTVVACPEHSHPGESQSNGKAERAVQEAEDMLITMRIALEERINANICSTYAVLKWLCEHVAGTINRFHVGSYGKTAYERAHGQR